MATAIVVRADTARRLTARGVPQLVRDFVAARELITNLVRRDLTIRHRGSLLGMVWSLTTPLLQVALYSFIFTFILRTSPVQEGVQVPFAVYFFCGLVIWNLFQNSVGAATGSIVGAGYLLRKVYFPRAVLPLVSVLASAVTFLFELAVLLAAVLVFVREIHLTVLYLPLIILVVLLLGYGMALLTSSLTVFFRDIEHFMGIFLQLWFWGTPIIYSLQFVADKPLFVDALQANPMTGPVVSLRLILLDGLPPDWKLLGYSAAVGVVLLGVGLAVFQRLQARFSELV